MNCNPKVGRRMFFNCNGNHAVLIPPGVAQLARQIEIELARGNWAAARALVDRAAAAEAGGQPLLSYDELLGLSVHELGLRPYLAGQLENRFGPTVGHLVQRSEAELAAVRYIGPRQAKLVVAAVRQLLGTAGQRRRNA